MAGKAQDAERILREVIERATAQARPLLVAVAQRDLAYLLAREGEGAAAKEVARTARATFHRLGSKVEIEKLDALLTQPTFATPELGRSQPATSPTPPDGGAAIRTRDLSFPTNDTLGPS